MRAPAPGRSAGGGAAVRGRVVDANSVDGGSETAHHSGGRRSMNRAACS